MMPRIHEAKDNILVAEGQVGAYWIRVAYRPGYRKGVSTHLAPS